MKLFRRIFRKKGGDDKGRGRSNSATGTMTTITADEFMKRFNSKVYKDISKETLHVDGYAAQELVKSNLDIAKQLYDHFYTKQAGADDIIPTTAFPLTIIAAALTEVTGNGTYLAKVFLLYGENSTGNIIQKAVRAMGGRDVDIDVR